MSGYRCPQGHLSETDDFCDTCGARIAGAAVAAPAPAVVAAAPAGDPDCPLCGTPRSGSARFCEDCGYDHSTGKVPQLTDVVPTTPVNDVWTATISADPEYFAANDIEGVVFPIDAESRTVVLPPPQVRIGRRSASKGTNPELDLSAPPADPGVSHSHALLTLNIDGGWLLSDLGSTNGTYVNDEEQPLTAGQSRTLKDGDQVHVGAWTTITLHGPPTG